tara:strand:+ start:5167 stop:5376 length:210 start_codon:yes stop_codon:yes gene_type:complete
MKVGDLVRVKPEHQETFEEIASVRGEEPCQMTGLVERLEDPRSNGEYVKLHNRPYAAYAGYFEVISEVS